MLTHMKWYMHELKNAYLSCIGCWDVGVALTHERELAGEDDAKSINANAFLMHLENRWWSEFSFHAW